MGLKGSKREAMYQMPPDRKRYLLQQNRQSKSSAPNPKASSSAASIGPSGAAAVLPLVPQLTGSGGIMKRFSMWGSPLSPTHTGESKALGSQPVASSDGSKRRDSTDKAIDSMEPLQPQSTGGLWSSWWASSGGDKPSTAQANKDTTNSAKWYVDGIRTGRPTDSRLVKHLISLRVHLSTAKLIWIEEFLTEEKGMDTIATLLANLVGKGGKRKKLADVEATVLLEVIKCLRVLLNTEV